MAKRSIQDILNEHREYVERQKATGGPPGDEPPPPTLDEYTPAEMREYNEGIFGLFCDAVGGEYQNNDEYQLCTIPETAPFRTSDQYADHLNIDLHDVPRGGEVRLEFSPNMNSPKKRSMGDIDFTLRNEGISFYADENAYHGTRGIDSGTSPLNVRIEEISGEVRMELDHGEGDDTTSLFITSSDKPTQHP